METISGIVINGIFWFLFAISLAILEIHIEGKDGWAKNIPTWYRKTGIGKIFGIFMHKKPMTGYHVTLMFFLFLIFHAHYFQGCEWNIQKEFSTLGLLLTIFVVWDYLWFVFNPYFGYKNFRKEKIWWHATSKWFLGFPSDFYSNIFIALIFNFLANDIKSYLIKLGILFIGTIIAIIVSPLYHKFYFWIREKDERDLI
jgi:uncharacterized membrane protein